MSEQIEHTEAPAAKPKPARTKQHRRPNKRPKRGEAPASQPEEFAGLTAFDCCNACQGNIAAAEKAQHRLNELEMMYPRRPAPPIIHPVTGWRTPAASVMESDEQYLARNPQLADEFQKLSKAVQGPCHISGLPGCAHPHKGGLNTLARRDSKAMQRYLRAKKLLEHQKIDLRG